MMKKQSEKAPAPFFNIGASSLLVIFLILCLVTFAILTLASAKSDADFAEKLADRKTAYYEACNSAENILDEIDSILTDAWQLSGSNDAAGNSTNTNEDSTNTDTDNRNDASTENDNSRQHSSTQNDTAIILNEIEARLTALSDSEQLQLSMDFAQDEPTVSYTVTIDENQELQVTLTLSAAPVKGDAYYRISQWQVKASGKWNGDQTLNLMK